MKQVYSASTSSLIRRRVKNHRGESLGRIEDLVVDLDRGFIAYAVLGFFEWVDQVPKRFVVPWGALHVDPADRSFVLDIALETLRRTAGVDADVPAPQPRLREKVCVRCELGAPLHSS